MWSIASALRGQENASPELCSGPQLSAHVSKAEANANSATLKGNFTQGLRESP